MTELVPAPWTNESTQTEARTLMTRVGQVPVSLSRELPGFVLNRMQYALLNECWRLLANKVVSVDDLDVVMRDGLGLRYAFMGNTIQVYYKIMIGLMANSQRSHGNYTLERPQWSRSVLPNLWKHHLQSKPRSWASA